MRVGIAVILALGVLCMALPAGATQVTSSFVNFVYTYTVTPAPGEAIRDFHIYASSTECDPAEYLNLVMPPGWAFALIPDQGKCAITWYTTGAPLPVGVPTTFSFVHYCAPCCHTWWVTGTGEPNPGDPSIDGSWNHPNEPCNIPPPFDVGCPASLGGVVAPIYPVVTPVQHSAWGGVKILYR